MSAADRISIYVNTVVLSVEIDRIVLATDQRTHAIASSLVA